MTLSQIDILWVLASTCVLFVMQIGFLCIETGLSRSKNSIGIAIRNIVGFALSAIMFWLVGFGIMFGATYMGYIGSTGFASSFSTPPTATLLAVFTFQLMFCAVAVNIVAGAAAERMRFGAYTLIACIVAAIVYPVFGHWVWNGLLAGTKTGWLGRLGFVDFAGASVVHSVGGWTALAAIMVLGARTGRFDSEGRVRPTPKSNVSMASIGLLLIMLGWLGFTGGSSYSFDGQVPGVIARTLIAGAAGLLIGALGSWRRAHAPYFETILIGGIAGLVSITGAVHAVSFPAAIVIGASGALFAIAANRFLIRNQVDDATNAIAAHLVSGVWGTIAVGIFGDPALLGTGLNFQEQVGAQLIGIAVCGLWAFGVSWIVLSIVNRVMKLRVSAETERIGLNQHEHGAYSELSEFTRILALQSRTGDLSLRAPITPFTDYGQLAVGYNQVMDRLENESKRSDAIVSNARDGIIVFDEETLAIDMVNPAAERIFGVSAEDILDHQIVELFDLDGLGNPRAIFNYILDTTRHYELTGYHSDGSDVPLEVSIAQTVVSGRSVFIASIRDVEDRESQKHQLETLNAKLVESNQYKDEFMASMSHELRTPLNAILGMSEALNADVYGPLSPKQQKAADNIHNSGKHLLTIIDDILDLSKISAGEQRLDVHPVSIEAICEASIALVEPLATKKNLEISTNYDPQVKSIQADPTRLKQILVNLLNNAVKFTNEDGKIGIMVVGAPSSDQVHLIVWDTGVGIDDSELNRLFEPFVQGDGSYGRRFGGAGLGLAIVNRLVKLHGGRVRVTSEVDKGSRFIISLPWQPRGKTAPSDSRAIAKTLQSDKHTQEVSSMMSGVEETIIAAVQRYESPVEEALEESDEEVTMPQVHQSEVTVVSDSAETDSPKVLLAEDNEANIKTLSDYLKAHGFDITVARNGLEAIENVSCCTPDIVLMDIQMPKMDGLTAIRRIRQEIPQEQLPIIALTAFAMPGDRERCLSAGANEYLSKPVGLKSLVQRINTQIGRNNGTG